MEKSQMTCRNVRDAAEFPALVIAAFFVRNSGILFALMALALFAMAAG